MKATGVILPALDAAAHLGPLLASISCLHPDIAVLVVDDGSSDDTAAVAARGGAEVLVHPENRGKGAALACGFAWALDKGLDWVYTMDSDGQHLPTEMASFHAAALDDGLDVVVGTRMDAAQNMPWLRKATNIVTSGLVSALAGCPVPDSQSGFRLLRVELLADLVLRTSRYDTESEILVRLAWRGARIGAVPITSVYGEERSSIRPLRDTGRFLRLVTLLLRDRSRSRKGSAE